MPKSKAKCKQCGRSFVFQTSRAVGKFCSKDCDIMWKTAQKPCPDCGHTRCKQHARKKQQRWRATATKQELKAKSMQVAYRNATDRRSTLSLDEARKIIVNPPTCPYCQQQIKWQDLSIDHKLPRSRGGSSTPDNLIWVDLKCNIMKGNLTDHEFVKLMEFLKNYPEMLESVSVRLRAGAFAGRLQHKPTVQRVGDEVI